MDQKEAERTYVLTRDTYYQAFDGLQNALPPPKPGDPKDRERRDNRAMAEVGGLVPVNAAEVKLAVLFVATSAHAEVILGTVSGDDDAAQKARARAASMMRQSFVALSLLMRLQAARAKREANNATADSAAWTEHFALEYMTEARARSQQGCAEAEPTTAEDVSILETKSQIPVNEMTTRQADVASAPETGPEIAPAPPSVSNNETKSSLSVNEMPMRRDAPGSTTDDVAGPQAPSGRSVPEPATGTIVRGPALRQSLTTEPHLDRGLVETMCVALAGLDRRAEEARKGRASLLAGTSLS